MDAGTKPHTDKQDEAVCWRFCFSGPIHLEQAHARHYWADKVNVKDGEDVDKVKHGGNRQKLEAREARHGSRWDVARQKRRTDVGRMRGS